ncbi:MAG: carbon-nitrogen family hydrolase [Nitrospirae bacterium CG_4_9_14_3_um_filter_53_35]|nr:MAG: carbon-nitrogen family hydrolase [Nitrospirae bacterium CG08_land_8_20_14_0_20_52_24]PIV82422.1 MAG: carbon-nitrogen family hydrolase [Nitrospirae bacterium CG17_big_fil_post_rev_8_21_14_2_50_50_9]PIX86324.1 MAG: carbon-nitrogen family hydrolase [Nitrospirae bacterium CG_4_10_14_3_um_filter_53_41]PJA77455.1 MAG: carbon-nitrogen family hydrolase [Nitrospirae bacterium CG_4_9_14_3_um_filter_53_35]
METMTRIRNEIRVSLLQINPGLHDPDRRIEKTLNLIRRTAESRPGILVLPEIWSGGFEYPDVLKLSPRTPDILNSLCEISGTHGTMIIGSLPEKESGRLYNTAAVVDHGRIIGRYRKRRLFPPMLEDRYFTPGRSRKIFSTAFGRIGIAVCFDLRFPEHFAGFRGRGAWLLIVPAQWPEPRCAQWESLLIARAIENQAFVAGCNRAGRTRNTRFCGNSLIVDPGGTVIARGGRDVQVVSAVLRPGAVETIRKEIPMQTKKR